VIWFVHTLSRSLLISALYHLYSPIPITVPNVLDIYQLQGMSKAAIQKFLSQIEQEFHMKFDFTVADELTKRIAAADRGGLGIFTCLMAVRTQGREYYRMIEADVPRDTALRLFDQAETCTISLPLLRKAMELMR